MIFGVKMTFLSKPCMFGDFLIHIPFLQDSCRAGEVERSNPTTFPSGQVHSSRSETSFQDLELGVHFFADVPPNDFTFICCSSRSSSSSLFIRIDPGYYFAFACLLYSREQIEGEGGGREK